MSPLLIILLVLAVCLAAAPLLLGRFRLRGVFYPVLLFWDRAQRSLVLAGRSLWLHKLRAMLSVLGIIIGTAAVISLMAFGEGSMHDALEDIKRQGATNIIIKSAKPPDDASNQRRTFVAAYGLTYKDFDRFQILAEPGPNGEMPTVTRMVPMRIFPQEIRRHQHMHNGRVVGTTPQYQEVNQFNILPGGRFLVEKDVQELADVVVLGAAVAEALFPFENPVGKTVVLSKHDYTVIGVLDERLTAGGSGPAAEEFNSDVYVPVSTCRARFGERIYIRASGSRSAEQVELHQITLTVGDMDKVRAVGAVIYEQLENSHYKKDWSVTIPLDRLEEAERARDRYKMLLVLIASISLVVGGIGIMNIMLATVTERTREIGIRRALGAKRRDITLQFLVEAMVQTSLGGLVGVLVGLALVFGVPWVASLAFDQTLPARLHVPSIFWSLGAAIIVGVLSGLYPALRASWLDPIEALRHE
ncbi:MAG: ABC transporter permease [Gemmataceae bacterium]|nr:ABC transporter permease [Gemmataceae bacterium]